MWLYRLGHYLKKVGTPFWVITAHLCLVGITIATTQKKKGMQLPPKPIKIHEKVYTPPPPARPSPRVTAPQPKPAPPKPKKVARTVKRPQKKAPPKQKKSRELLAQLDASLEKIENQTNQIAFSKGPALPDNIKVHTDHSQIASYFADHLELPEKGDVTLTITVQPNGKIVRIQVVSCRSDCNKKYLLARLKEMKLPAVGSDEAEITVTFCGEG